MVAINKNKESDYIFLADTTQAFNSYWYCLSSEMLLFTAIQSVSSMKRTDQNDIA